MEADALTQLAHRMTGSMEGIVQQVVEQIVRSSRQGARVITTGVGKSGYIAQKTAATLNSLGIASQFLHAAEAVHGDIGMVQNGDTILAFSYSGETEELIRLFATFSARQATLVAISGCSTSTLARAAAFFLDASVAEEACPLKLAPTASTTVMLALADALAVEAGQQLGVRAEDFALFHPGGRLGKRLQKVATLMHAADRIPTVSNQMLLPAVIHEMSAKRLGMTTVVDAHNVLLGVISDGDLRRILEQEGGHALLRSAEEVMTRNPATVAQDTFASEAMEMMEARRITSLVVVDGARHVQGVLHLHDLWER